MHRRCRARYATSLIGYRGRADNGGLPFMVVDKVNARLFLFDAGGALRATTPILVGLARGDDSPPGIGARASCRRSRRRSGSRRRGASSSRPAATSRATISCGSTTTPASRCTARRIGHRAAVAGAVSHACRAWLRPTSASRSAASTCRRRSTTASSDQLSTIAAASPTSCRRPDRRLSNSTSPTPEALDRARRAASRPAGRFGKTGVALTPPAWHNPRMSGGENRRCAD